ncbi:MAG: hypothetical protein Q7S60_03250 [bacterium]|nr:hypothetical protein [bacterium]
MQDIELTSFAKIVSESRSVLILIPANPDLDSVAAALALSLSLKSGGKEISVACPTPMIVEFNRLVGVNRVTDKLGSRNLAISLENYKADSIEKVSYDIEGEKFTLVLVPKAGSPAPQREQVKIDFAGVSADIVIVVKAENKESLGMFASNGEIWDPARKIVLLGNFPAQGFQGALEMINPQATCVSEVAFRVIESAGLPIDEDTATNLFLGLHAGTNHFQSQNVVSSTFEVASRLVSLGARTKQEFRPVEAQKQAPADWLGPKVYKGSTLP